MLAKLVPLFFTALNLITLYPHNALTGHAFLRWGWRDNELFMIFIDKEMGELHHIEVFGSIGYDKVYIDYKNAGGQVAVSAPMPKSYREIKNLIERFLLQYVVHLTNDVDAIYELSQREV